MEEIDDENELKPIAKILRTLPGYTISVWVPGPRDARRIDIRKNKDDKRNK